MKTLILYLMLLVACVHPVTKNTGTTILTGLAALDNNPHLTVSSLQVTPTNETHIVGESIGYTAQITLSNGQTYNVTNIASWVSTNNSIAMLVSQTTFENFQCMSAGAVQIVATFGSVSNSTGLNCTGTPPPTTLSSITMSPTLASINVGQIAQFSASGTFSDGSTQDVTAASVWTSSDTTVATIGALTTTQAVKCIKGGSVTVTATDGSIVQTVTLNCNAVLLSISVTPAAPQVLVGATSTFTGTGTYNDGSSQDVTGTCTWASSNTAVATFVPPVTTVASFNALSAGTATISCTLGVISGTTTLTVTSSGPPPPTLSSITVTPSNKTINVGSTLALTATGNYSDGSTQNLSSQVTWTTSNLAIASLQLKDGVVGTSYSVTIPGTGTTPYTFSVPGAPAPGGAEDTLDYAAMPLPDRNSFHLTGSDAKYFKLDGSLLWWIKNSTGNPWDGEAYDSSYIKQWFTEGPTWGNASGYKRYINPVNLWKRYHVPGADDIVYTAGPNRYNITESCGTDNLPTIDNLGVRGELTGPFTDINWTTTYGGSIPNATPYLLAQKWIKCTANNILNCTNEEDYWLVKGYGQVRWCAKHLSGGVYVTDQCTTNTNKVAGGAPTPNFACKVPPVPITGGLPPGQSLTSAPSLNLVDSTGVLSGTPNTPGTYSFVVQQEDGTGAFHLTPETIVVNAVASTATQTVNGVSAGTATITATLGLVSANTNVTVQAPAPTLSSIALTPSPISLAVGGNIGVTATGTYSDTSTQNLTSSAIWLSSNTAVAVIASAGSPRLVTCVAVGTANVTAQVGAVTSPVDTVTCVTPVTGQGGNINCSASQTWLGPTTDGPAALPTSCMNTLLANNPSPGVVHGPYTTLSALQTAINAGACGDVYTVTAGTDLGTGTLTLPQKNCDAAHWNWIRTTGTTNPNFPAEGVRMTPCWGGFGSLPNRPAYSCSSPTNLLFKISAGNASNAVVANKGDHWRITGALITRVPTGGVAIFNLVDLTASSNPQTHHIIFDRVWFAGIEGTFPSASQTTDTSTTRAIYLGQSNHIAVIDSYFSNFYDTSVRSANGNTDAQCVGGGAGSVTGSGWGVYKFVNNHCEASGEGILLGGSGGPALTPSGCTIMVNCNVDAPTDVEVRQNYFFKPPQWNGNTTTPGGTGWPVVKNGFEMKTGVRMLFEGNVIENCWYNSQVCYTFSIAPVNQQSGGTTPVPTCSTCVITDATYRFNYGYSVAYGIGLYAFAPTTCNTCLSQGGNRISIHDNLIGDNLNLGSLTLQGAGDELQLFATSDSTGKGLSQLNNINIIHNTFVKGIRALAIFGSNAPTATQMHTWTVQNNIWAYATYGVEATASSPSACDAPSDNSDKLYNILQACVAGWTWDHNAVFNWNGGVLGNNWPTDGKGAGNIFQQGSTNIGFVNYNSANSNFNPGNYAIQSNSVLHNAGSDGKDIGADITTLVQKIAGVRQ